MNQDIHIYNSLTKKKELFKPISKGFVGIYTCGPTVYSEPHIGNIRSFICFDIIVRTFKYLGYKVRYVRNITDIGHLTDNNEDKIEKKAKIERLEPMEIAQKYANSLRTVSHTFNLLSPSIEPLASGHIPEQINMIKLLIKDGLAYEKNGSVYFDTRTYNKLYKNYGDLSSKKLDELRVSVRENLEKNDEKKFFADFSLWKQAESGTITKWNPPWGEGARGWHLECSAMSTKYLGAQFDIHGGGMDLKFPHHECEIAQSTAINKKSPANYWIHNNMLTVNGTKMSKSLGNHINTKELIEGSHPIIPKLYSPMVIKFFFLQTNYKSTADFSNKALEQSEKGYYKLISSLDTLNNINPSKTSDFDCVLFIEQCLYDLTNDFDTPNLLAKLFNGVKIINNAADGKIHLSIKDIETLKTFFNTIIKDVLGFHIENKEYEKPNLELTKDLIDYLLELRSSARSNKNFNLADSIRDKMSTLNINVTDTKDGFQWTID